MGSDLNTEIDGIKAYKGVPSLQISQYRHPAWTTTVFVVPRSSIRFRMNVKEFENNCIYFTYERSTGENLYVGQAGVRNKGKGVIQRLKEHESDNLKDAWDIAFVFTSIITDDTSWNGSTLDIIENDFERKTHGINVNRKTPTKSGKTTSDLEEIIHHIEVYMSMLVPELFHVGDDTVKEEQDELRKNELSLEVRDLQDDFSVRNITTPLPTVKNMWDMVENNVELNHTLKILDMACKGGEFLYEGFQRLMKCNDQFLKDKTEYQRAMYILNNQLYGLTSSSVAFLETNNLLYGDDEVRNIHHIKNFENAMALWFKKGYKYGIDQVRKLLFVDIFKDNFKGDNIQDMKFDVIIGNPPYSDNESRGTTGSGNAVYPYFMVAASELAIYSSLIVPSGWMLQYPTGVKHEDVDIFRRNKHIKELHDYMDSYQIFKGVGIKTGVCYYILDNTKSYDACVHEVITENKDKYIVDNLPLFNEDADVCFRDRYVLSISSKIKWGGGQYKFISFAEICAGAKHHFDDGKTILTSIWNDYSSIETDTYNIKYFLKSNNRVHKGYCTEITECGMPNFGYAWINKNQIPRNVDDCARYKVLMGQICNDNYRVMDVPQYVGKNTCCSQSYIPIFSPHNTEEECLNICKYIKTRFFRYLVSVLKIGQNLGNRVYKLVPIQNFFNNSDINWNASIRDIENQLYTKYNLSKEEIDYIESIIKPME